MVNNKTIVDAQKVLSKWQGTSVRMLEEHGKVFWQITFDNDTYGKMLNVVSSVAETPIKDTYNQPQRPIYNQTYSSYNTNPDAEYHREKI